MGKNRNKRIAQERAIKRRKKENPDHVDYDAAALAGESEPVVHCDEPRPLPSTTQSTPRIALGSDSAASPSVKTSAVDLHDVKPPPIDPPTAARVPHAIESKVQTR